MSDKDRQSVGGGVHVLKLQDFASQCGVTDRQIQRLLKKYESEVVGHFERRGVNGTWLDDEACTVLRSKMKIKEIVVADKRIKELEDKIERKDVIIERLQQREQEKDLLIEELKKEQLRLEDKEQEIEKLKAENQEKDDLAAQYKEQADEEHLQNQELRKKLEEERNKTWWDKLWHR